MVLQNLPSNDRHHPPSSLALHRPTPSIKMLRRRPPRPVNAKVQSLDLLSSTKAECYLVEGTIAHKLASPGLLYLPSIARDFAFTVHSFGSEPWRITRRRKAGGNNATTNRISTFPFHQPFAHTPRHPPLRPHH